MHQYLPVSGSWKLKQTKQCAKCPWKISTNPHEIPNGYSVEKHEALEETIAKNLDNTTEQLENIDKPLKVMSCHDSGDSYCIGWLNNQLGAGNNILLRIQMMNCENVDQIVLDGEQHSNFQDTLPK